VKKQQRAAWWGHGDLAASLVLVMPLFLTYQIGVLFYGNVNGADVVTRAAYGALGRSTYLLVNATLAIGFLVWLRRTQRWNTLRLEIVAQVFLEAAIYALTLGALVTLLLERVLGLGLSLHSLVDALGAGVHEELVFRLALLGGLVALLQRSELDPRLGVAIAMVVSAVAFSAAHHAGTYGEPFTTHAFAFRCLAGVAFGLVFWFRSLAHAVYAHALYDILVYWRG
jgi:hypothetical protein